MAKLSTLRRMILRSMTDEQLLREYFRYEEENGGGRWNDMLDAIQDQLDGRGGYDQRQMEMFHIRHPEAV